MRAVRVLIDIQPARFFQLCAYPMLANSTCMDSDTVYTLSDLQIRTDTGEGS